MERNEYLNILLVEDSVADARLIKEALLDTDIQHTLNYTIDGEEALLYLRECLIQDTTRIPDVVVLDLNMPRVNGHQFLESMRKESALKNVPVVVLTVSQDEEDITKALDLGMNYYLRKPPTAATIGPLLKRIVELWSYTGMER